MHINTTRRDVACYVSTKTLPIKNIPPQLTRIKIRCWFTPPLLDQTLPLCDNHVLVYPNSLNVICKLRFGNGTMTSTKKFSVLNQIGKCHGTKKAQA